MKKSGIIILIIILVALFFIFRGGEEKVSLERPVKIGAILPLTGPAAIWGESIRNGMEIALEDINKDEKLVEILYEDSQTLAKEGVSAFNKLVGVNNVDAVFSAISSVSVPLVPLAEEKQVPLIMSLVSAEGVTEGKDFTFRIFPTSRQRAEMFFPHLNNLEIKTLGVLYVNDEFGSSMIKDIKEIAERENIQILSEESYAIGASDFRTQLTKIKEKNPESLFFVGIPPRDLQTALIQYKELDMSMPFFELAGILADLTVRESMADLVEKAYAMTYGVNINEEGNEFREKHLKRFGVEPVWASSFGYDAITIIVKAAGRGFGNGVELAKNILNLENYTGVNGRLPIDDNGEIMISIFPAQIINGDLVVIE